MINKLQPVTVALKGFIFINKNIRVILGIALISTNQRPVFHSLHRKVSDYSDNLNLAEESLNWFKCVETVFRDVLSSPFPMASLSLDTIEILSMF